MRFKKVRDNIPKAGKGKQKASKAKAGQPKANTMKVE